MADQRYQVRDSSGNRIGVVLRRDKRLTKTSRWERMPDGSLLLRVPYRLPKHRIGPLLEQVSSQLDRQTEVHSRRNDETLAERARMINKKYFKGELHWNAIRWVSNMQSRLGSCTRGGPTDGQIRISEKIKEWPLWVIDYVIAHEILHRKYSNHSDAFWSELKDAYPFSEKAIGFITGVNYATGKPVDGDGVDTIDPAQASTADAHGSNGT